MRVLVVTAMYPRADAPTLGTFVLDQVHTLRRLGVVVDVLDIGGGRGPLKYALGCWRVFAATLRRRYDVVHGHYGFAGVVARCQVRAPVVVTFHGSDINLRLHRPLSWLAAALATEVIVVSQPLAPLVGRPAAEVIPCGVDIFRFRPIPKLQARQALGLDAAIPIILFPGSRARSVKRFDRLQAALAQLPRTVKVLALEGVPHERVALYLNAADCVVLTSDAEGSPVVVREALACNAPVVSVNVGDVQGWLEGVTPGATVGKSTRELADAIMDVLRSGLRSNGRIRAQAFSADAVAQRVLAVYKRAAAPRRRRSPAACRQANP